MSTAAFHCQIGQFVASTAFEKLGRLISQSAQAGFGSHYHKQTTAWESELHICKRLANDIPCRIPHASSWWMIFEYEIPRREKRPDLILLADDLIFVIEFKIGADRALRSDKWQAYSYALDLRDFHEASRERVLIPMLVATDLSSPSILPTNIEDLIVQPVTVVNGEQLAARIAEIYNRYHSPTKASIAVEKWIASAYRPTPTIIEAAENLFAGHDVANISHAFATNLDATTDAIIHAVETAQRDSLRTICFVTGTPGAGKTLTGLNVVHNPRLRANDRPAGIFLSGNGPLLTVLKEALVRDQQKKGVTRAEAKHVVSTFVANVHRFLTEYGIKSHTDIPPEHVIVFDEAQRAWHAHAVSKRHGILKSEPTLILEIMERVPDWCVIVALVGGGQEIHHGEAGLEEWGAALNARATPWTIHISPDLADAGSSVAGHHLFESAPKSHLRIVEVPDLHLRESVRSPRARRLATWVDALLRNEPKVLKNASEAAFPIVLTRNLADAKQWMRNCADPKHRLGLLASSGALRLRADGVEVSSGFRSGYDYAQWFLSDDLRSSSALEVAATEFECQGLELDWTCVCWGGDLVIDPHRQSWRTSKFHGCKWVAVNRAEQRRYIINKYRVLLTRARVGMVIWVPCGDPDDPTRNPHVLDATAEYLHACGITYIDDET